LMISWSRSPMARSGSCISPSLSLTTFSPSALRAAAFCSWARSFVVARSSAVNPWEDLLVALVFFADFGLSFVLLCLRSTRTDVGPVY
jgi:hypothetical protein